MKITFQHNSLSIISEMFSLSEKHILWKSTGNELRKWFLRFFPLLHSVFQDDENSGFYWNILYKFKRRKRSKRMWCFKRIHGWRLIPNTRTCLVLIYMASVVGRNKRRSYSTPSSPSPFTLATLFSRGY